MEPRANPRDGGRTSGASVTGGGGQVEYVYDGAGNLVELRAASGQVVVSGFEPPSGGFDALVTVQGAGFSAAPSGNVVTLGGVPASVLEATSTSLTFSVPFGATSGKIGVTRGRSTGLSSSAFVVDGGVRVTGFTPSFGKAGTLLDIAGANFDPDRHLDTVTIGGVPGTVHSASRERLEVTAPPGGVAGAD